MIVTELVRIPPENGAPLKIRRKARQKSGADRKVFVDFSNSPLMGTPS